MRMDEFPCATRLLMGASSLSDGSGRRAERDSKTIERAHQADGIGKVSEFLVVEFDSGGLIVDVGNAGFGHPRHCFGPGQRGALARTVEFTRAAPHRHEQKLINGNARLEQVAGVHVDAVGTAVDLRNAQIHEINQLLWKAALLEIDVDTSKSLEAFR